MADDRKRDLMRYDLLAQEALRGVVRKALERAATPKGIPGEHHFYISFQTKAPGVEVPAELVRQYPEEMTVVLQHQFWDLKVEEAGFSVVLRFGGQPRTLVVPYAAVTRFHDPSVPFALQFDAPEPAPPPPRLAGPPETKSEEGAGPGEADGPKIVSLDQFRKK